MCLNTRIGKKLMVTLVLLCFALLFNQFIQLIMSNIFHIHIQIIVINHLAKIVSVDIIYQSIKFLTFR